MQVKSIAECSKGSILQYFRPSLSYHLSLRLQFCPLLRGRLRQVLLYMYSISSIPISTVCYMYIQEAAQSLLTAALNGSQLPNITERARQYILRCEELKKIGKCDYSRIQSRTVKPVLSGHSKIDKTKILLTNGSLMKVESIAECSHWSILQHLRPALSDIWSWKQVLGTFESGCFRQVLLYIYVYMYLRKYTFYLS